MPDIAAERISWKETRARLRADRLRIRRYQAVKFGYTSRTYFLDPSYVCVGLYRIARYFWCRGQRRIAHIITQANTIITGADMHPGSDIGPGLLPTTSHGLCISGKIGANATFTAMTGIGTDWKDKDVGAGPGLAVLGEHVSFAPYSCALGAVLVGDDARFGIGAVGNADVPASAAVDRIFTPAPGAIAPRPQLQRPTCFRDHGRWRNTFRDFRSDVDRYLELLLQHKPAKVKKLTLLSALLTSQILALGLYRLSHRLYVRRWRRLAFAVCWLNILINKTTIHPGSCIGARMLVPHPSGFVFCGSAGEEPTFYGESICAPLDGALNAPVAAGPALGERVIISGHAGVFGPVTIGDGARVLLKAHATYDMPPKTLAFSPMARARVRDS